MAYKALYRTYRPSTFDEVAGQKHIVKTLQNALASNKVAHAYLFTGPRGTGKTSMAKLMAKALNCEEGFGHQCNKCPNCLAINDGSHPDVIEIDAASNNGVEEVRDLIDKVKYAPIKGQYKIYIIDEVHMMTSGAFNALLKTLEEPPAYVVFILATTEPHKVLPTIVSRCQRYDFAKVNEKDIQARLYEIMKAENVTFEQRALDTIISLADGGVRDALSMLDQVLAYSGSHLSEQDILDLFGLAGTLEKINLLKHVAAGNTAAILDTLGQFHAHGVDFKRLVGDLLDILKDLLVYLKTSKIPLLTVLSSLEADDLLEALDYELIPSYMDVLLKAQSDFRFVSNIRSLVEVVLLKMSRLKTEKNLPIPVTPKETKKTEAAPTIAIKEEPKPEPIATPKETIEFKPVDLSTNHTINNIPKVPLPENHNGEKTKEETGTIFNHIEAKPVMDEPVIPDIEETSLAANGDKITIDDDNIIKIMVSGLKEEKVRLYNRWDDLKPLIALPNLGKFASLIRDATPYVLSKQILLLECDTQNIADKMNSVANQATLQHIINVILNRKLLVYGLTRSECIRLKKKYFELHQIKKLPDRNEMNIAVQGYTL